MQQEYNSLFVNALNHIFKSNLSLISNGCLQNWSFRAFEILYPVLENASEMPTPRSKSGDSKPGPRWAAHTRIGNVWEYPPPRVQTDTSCRPFIGLLKLARVADVKRESGRGNLGARERAREKGSPPSPRAVSRPQFPSPSLSNACLAGYLKLTPPTNTYIFVGDQPRSQVLSLKPWERG